MIGFLHPWVLLALPVAAAPVAIHWLRRRRARRLRFPGAVLLLRGARADARRRRIEDLVLLALRVAALAAAVILFARPLVRGLPGQGDGAKVLAAVAIVLDDTASMAATDTRPPDGEPPLASLRDRASRQGFNRTARTHKTGTGATPANGQPGPPARRFDAVRAAAQRIVERLAPGSEIVLARATDPGGARRLFDPAEAQRRLRRAEVSMRSAPLAPAISAAAELLEQSSLPVRVLYVLSDLTPASLAGLEDLLPLRGIALKVLDVGGPGENWAVTRLRTGAGRVTARVPVEIIATIARRGRPNGEPPRASFRDRASRQGFNSAARTHKTGTGATPDGATGPQRITVGLYLEGSRTQGQPVQTRQVRLAHGKSVEVAFRVLPTDAGPFGGRVELEAGDVLALDDARYFSLRVDPPLRVHVIGAGGGGGAADRVLTALAPFQSGQHARAVVRLVRPAEVGAADRADVADVMVVIGEAPLPGRTWLALSRYVSAGGGLLYFAGRREAAEGAGPLLPAAVTGAPVRGRTRLALRAERHPLLRPFRGGANGELERVAFHIRAALAQPGLESAVLARFTGGEPAIVAKRLSRGRVLMIAALPDPTWTDLPQEPAFVPLIHEAVAWLAARDASLVGLVAGEPVRLAVRPGEAGHLLTVRPPQGPVVSGSRGEVREPAPNPSASPVEIDRRTHAGVFTDTHRLGRYGVFLRTRTSGDRAPMARSWGFAVNLDPAESDLSRGRAELLARLARAGVMPDAQSAVMSSALALHTSLPGPGRDATGACLVLLVVLLLAESALAGALSRRRDSPGGEPPLLTPHASLSTLHSPLSAGATPDAEPRPRRAGRARA